MLHWCCPGLISAHVLHFEALHAHLRELTASIGIVCASCHPEQLVRLPSRLRRWFRVRPPASQAFA